MKLSKEDINYLPIRSILMIGVPLGPNSMFYKIANVIKIFLVILMNSLIVLGVVDGLRKNDFISALECGAIIVPFVQGLIKYCIIYHYRDVLVELLQERKYFWEITDKSIAKISAKRTNRIKTILSYYINSIFLSVAAVNLEPYVTGNISMHFYIPEGWFYPCALLVLAVMFVVSNAMLIVDALFLTITTPLIMQFKFLNHKLTTITFDKHFKKEIVAIIDHHNFLIRYCQKINKYFVVIFLTQFIITNTASLGILLAVYLNVPTMNIVAYVGYFSMTVMATSIYCVNAQAIAVECEKIADSIYNSNWQNQNIHSLQREISMIIEASSRVKIIFGAWNGNENMNITHMNMTTLTQIFKTTMSFYIFMKHIMKD